MRFRSAIARLLSIGFATLALTACGGDDDANPTSTPAATQQSITNDPTTSATLGPGEVTAGEIADRIGAAWAKVTSYRSITQILPATGTPAATPVVEFRGTAERHVIMPDTKQILITDQGATTEIVLVNGILSKRTISEGGQSGSWVTIDVAAVPANDPFAQTYETILAPEAPPYSGLGNRQRDRIGKDQGQSTINGRVCTGYLFPEVSAIGEQIRVVVYLGEDDLPCRIDTRAGLSISQTDYIFNQEVPFATPVALASPTTP